jgi:hypothetical protein
METRPIDSAIFIFIAFIRILHTSYQAVDFSNIHIRNHDNTFIKLEYPILSLHYRQVLFQIFTLFRNTIIRDFDQLHHLENIYAHAVGMTHNKFGTVQTGSIFQHPTL